jgi:DNA-binding transcriptional LysR family regulator
MRLEWIDDILAVLDCGSLARAADRRFLTQSAFTRRVRMIEENIGATLFDRRRKPVTLMPGVHMLEPELRDLSARLHKLRQALKVSDDLASRSVTFACQHALTTTVSPLIVRALTADDEASVRVRSGNKDECLMLLVSKEVDFAIMYGVPELTSPETGSAFDVVALGSDTLIPVCAPSMRAKAAGRVIPTINYPPEVFLGQLFGRMIRPRLPQGVNLVPVAETALTLAVLQYALNEIGIAWLPHSLVAAHLAEGSLVGVDDVLPTQALNIMMIRLTEVSSAQNDLVWRHVERVLRIPAN